MKYLLLSLLLVGCASPIPKVLDIPISEPCKTAEPDVPVMKYNPGTYTSVFEVVRDLKGDLLTSAAYQIELLGALKSCK